MTIKFGGDLKRIEKEYSISDNTVIFRYMDFVKFMDLLENSKLYFCNAKRFEDAYEGTVPAGIYEGRCERDIWYQEECNKNLPAYISCWNGGEAESYALWKIYTNPTSGVAIKSTVGKLRKSLSGNNINIYKIKYIKSFKDTEESYDLPVNTKDNFSRRVREVLKLDSYSYENEVRAVYIDNIKKDGITFDVDLKELIDEIYISPFAPKCFYDLVKGLIHKYDDISDKPLRKSSIKIR